MTLFLCPFGVKAQAPLLINFQGNLDEVDSSADFTGNVNLTFSIYTIASGGEKMWSELHQDVQVNQGVFQVFLGGGLVLPEYVDASLRDVFTGEGDRFLSLRVGNEEEIATRFQITSVAYAIKSSEADTARVAKSLVYQFEEKEAIQGTTSNTFVESDTSVDIRSDGKSAFLIQATCTVGHNTVDQITEVALYRGEELLVSTRQRVQIAEQLGNESVSLFHVDIPPVGNQHYSIRFLSNITGYGKYK